MRLLTEPRFLFGPGIQFSAGFYSNCDNLVMMKLAGIFILGRSRRHNERLGGDGPEQNGCPDGGSFHHNDNGPVSSFQFL